MGGKEGGRGYLYQGIATVLEALTTKSWDSIYIEFPTEEDKVDIALSNNGKIIRAIQVKSTQNVFAPGAAKKWVQDIYSDYKTDEYELVLIGQCAPRTLNFINAIPKYYNKSTVKLDQTATDALKDFDTSILDAATVKVRVLPFDLETLQSVLISALYKYMSEDNPAISFTQTDLLSKALITEQLLNSTNGTYTNRTSFEQDLRLRIQAISAEYQPKRIPICIKTFSRYSDHPDTLLENTLDLCEAFNDRKLKPSLTWHDNVVAPLVDFLSNTIKQTEKYKLYLDAHASISFMTGRLFDSKSGIDIVPVQKTTTTGAELWDPSNKANEDLPNWIVTTNQVNNDCFNTVLILNVTHDIQLDVERYIADSGLQIGKLISCSLSQAGGTNQAIQSGSHAAFLANKIHSVLACRTTPERRGFLHIFAAAPAGFMFYLGTVSRGFGKTIMYEYDFEQTDTCTYSPSITFDSTGGY